MDACCKRRRHYLPHFRTDWQPQFLRLCAVRPRLTDRQIAARLSDLFPEHPFTSWQVWYYRRELIDAAPGGRTDEQGRLLPVWQVRRYESNRHQVQRGLGHLLPCPYADVGPDWTPGVELTPRQADVLACIRDHGPLPRVAIARRLGIHPWGKVLSAILPTLLFLGLVGTDPGRRRRTYHAAPVAGTGLPPKANPHLENLTAFLDSFASPSAG